MNHHHLSLILLSHHLFQSAFEMYDAKYALTARKHCPPSFDEIRHILNIAQVMSSGQSIKLISFDGDQTLYSDGQNFEKNERLAKSIIDLIQIGVRVSVITAAGYGLEANKYETRLRGLLDYFSTFNLTEEEVSRFYVFGGECNYLLQCFFIEGSFGKKVAKLHPIDPKVWQSEIFDGPKPLQWPQTQIDQILNTAEKTMIETVQQLRLRAKVLRKDRAVGVYPGGQEMISVYPKGKGHGHRKLKYEALEEICFRVMGDLYNIEPKITIPYCVFNGGNDAWLDIGNKRNGMSALQSYFGLKKDECLHFGDQFLTTGNDIAARETSPCIWINSPSETAKVLEYLIEFMPDDRNSFIVTDKHFCIWRPKAKP